MCCCTFTHVLPLLPPPQLELASGEKGAGSPAATFVYSGRLTGADHLVGPSSGGDTLVLTLEGAGFNTKDLAQNQVRTRGSAPCCVCMWTCPAAA
jgi:hypothetical protein